MKFLFRSICPLAALMLSTVGASATPIVWTLTGVTFEDGGTASGTFTFNPDAGTACGSVSPCGTYSNVNIVTTAGSLRSGATYSLVCGQNVAGCAGVSPNSTEVLFLASNMVNESGAPAVAFFFTGISGLPPQGLTDLGGIIDISNSSGEVGTVQEASCADAGCSSPAGPARSSNAGSVSSAPEPATWWLFTVGLGLMATLRLQRRSMSKRCRCIQPQPE